jgi:hypothetical protein
MSSCGHGPPKRAVIQRTEEATVSGRTGTSVIVWFRRRRRSEPVPEPPAGRDASAYVLLEEAKLRCETLRGQARTHVRRQELHRLHRELGIAGLVASSNVPSHERHMLLERAHEQSARPVDQCSDPIRALVACRTTCISRTCTFCTRGSSSRSSWKQQSIRPLRPGPLLAAHAQANGLRRAVRLATPLESSSPTPTTARVSARAVNASPSANAQP